MNFTDAVAYCHVRSAIMRKSKPNKKYWKNGLIPIEKQVQDKDKVGDDWVEYDPRDHENCSLPFD
jgi:hypothetical protein